MGKGNSVCEDQVVGKSLCVQRAIESTMLLGLKRKKGGCGGQGSI